QRGVERIDSGLRDSVRAGVEHVDGDAGADREGLSLAVNAILANKERLAKAGIKSNVNKSAHRYYTGSVHLDFKVTYANDWFDIYATVKLDNMDVPFVALRPYILNDIHEFKLPDGSIIMLPDEWFERYKGVLRACEVNKKDNRIQLHSYQYSALDMLPLDGRVEDRVAALRQKLDNFDKIPLRQPSQVKATLRPYQIVAFNWLRMMRDCNFGACLADDMGLGKTLCTLSLLSDSPAVEAGDFSEGLFAFSKKIPSLLIVPKSLIYNWVSEAKKFVPHLKILEFTGNNRMDHIKSFPLFDIVISGYATLRNDIEKLSDCTFNYIVLDESQTVKNPESQAYQSIMQLKCRHRLALTGTPLENSLSDLWSQVNFINPGLLGSLSSFKRYYVSPIEKKLDGETSVKLKKIISPFMLRRTKQQVLQDLPDLVEQTILCEMTDSQQKIYEAEKSRTRNSILEIMEQGIFEKSTVMVLQSLTRLRQIACTPYLIEDGYDGGSGKTDEVIRALQNVIGQRHKVLVFSSFVQHLNHIARNLDALGIGYSMLTGSTDNREDAVRKFEGDNVPVFLISIKAGGTGLNLTQADYVFIIDPWWNPAVEEQAIARAHRMGQKNSVMAYRFISKGTVEEKIQRFQRKKNDLAATFVGDSEIPFNLKDEVMFMFD
ncbi:MAG: DEAD/DEAH box helicase, partial [Bacteroidales bacterium]|nr:DEAD/DEAH box helicase [Bacteroidales bacterium]